ncbi:ATP-binding protein [Paludibaculum fermentans]|uniref:ATP-binding protein n=1 Tax=Paludibaculum fermentans TaxID=1473598 RepID=A0A7S7SL82_PALFE|nr:ATP-binding protein [Paludibaculum fermentans]QOY88538.1 ATP-binding protein [Paludibaculum fermentans]
MPLYTLHTERHVLNVIGWMDWLTTDCIDELSAIDCAVLLMAAYTHDLGMAVSHKQYQELMDDAESHTPEWIEFQKFLDGYAEHKRRIEQLRTEGRHYASEQVRAYLLTEFLRRTHADEHSTRLKTQLDAIVSASGDGSLFRHANASFRHELELLAISHNQDPGWLRHKLGTAPILFGQQVLNLPLLGTILRLADVLDFDSSRTPGILFQHLGLDGTQPLEQVADNDGIGISQQEWRKHLAITGIHYDSTRSELTYSAKECPDPVTEKTIHSFLGWIREEVSTAQGQSRLRLPKVIADIKPARKADGKPAYEFHDWQFHLSHTEIVDLLMNESLYGDPGLAIRELAQNALDALELRDLRLQYRRKTGRNSSSAALDGTPTQTPGSFLDNSGQVVPLQADLRWDFDADQGRWWLEFSDNGVGMSKETIGRYFTNLGKSYYKSAEFEREKEELRRQGLIATPISQFGIGILSAFMLADRIEVKTNAGGGEKTDLTVSGAGSLFWTSEGSRPAQGTDVKLWLKPELTLVHDRNRSLDLLRTEFEYSRRRPGQKRYPPQHYDPFHQLALHVVWPMYPIGIHPPKAQNRSVGSDFLDGTFHIRKLIPMNLQLLREKAHKWDIELPGSLPLKWMNFDWCDNATPEATGSRIRIIAPGIGQSRDWDRSETLCDLGAWLVQSLVEDISETRPLVRSMDVADTTVFSRILEVERGVGLSLWVDLRGEASPRLKADRTQALPPKSEGEWWSCCASVFARFFAFLEANPASAWLSLSFSGEVRERLARAASRAENCSASELERRVEISLVPSREILESRFRGFQLNLAFAVALARDRNLARDLARDLDGDFNRDSDLDAKLRRAISIAHALAREGDLNLDLDLEYSIDQDLLSMLQHHLLQEACYPSLRQSWPPVNLYRYDGSIADAQLTAPCLFRFAESPDDSGAVIPPTTPNEEARNLTTNGFDLCFPTSAIPLWPLRSRLREWGRDRSLRRRAAMVFLFEKVADKYREQPKLQQSFLPAKHIYAFLPDASLWYKPFTEWEESDWQNPANRSMLWRIDEGIVVSRPGLRPLNEMHSLPADEPTTKPWSRWQRSK